MSTISQLRDPVAAAARALWRATEAIEQLTPEDLRDPGVASVAEQLWVLADEFEARIESASAAAA